MPKQETKQPTKRQGGKAVLVGAPSITGKSARLDALSFYENSKFPLNCVVVNNTRSKLVLPVVDAIIPAGGGKANVVFNDAEHVKVFITDAEQLCELHGSEDGIVLKTVEQDAEDEAAAAAAAAAAASIANSGDGQPQAKAKE